MCLRRLSIFENMILRRVSRPKRDEIGKWGSLYNEVFHSLYSSLYVIDWLVRCLLAVPDLWKRMQLKCSIAMIFTCPLLSWCTISSPFRKNNNVEVDNSHFLSTSSCSLSTLKTSKIYLMEFLFFYFFFFSRGLPFWMIIIVWDDFPFFEHIPSSVFPFDSNWCL